jgi:hypothetical protein
LFPDAPTYTEHAHDGKPQSGSHPEKVKVIGLGDPDEEPMIDEEYGILCEARMEGQVVTLPLGELEDAKPNRQLVKDYCYWFWNYR